MPRTDAQAGLPETPFFQRFPAIVKDRFTVALDTAITIRAGCAMACRVIVGGRGTRPPRPGLETTTAARMAAAQKNEGVGEHARFEISSTPAETGSDETAG